MALLDFPNVIGPNGSNHDSEMSHFVGVVPLYRMYPPFDRCFIRSGSTVVFSSVSAVSCVFIKF